MKENKRQTRSNSTTTPVLPEALKRRIREGLCIIILAIALFTFLSFISYHPADPSWSTTGLNPKAHNWGGKAGAFFSDIFLYLFGYISYFIPE